MSELEREASDIIGPWNQKEYDSLIEVCGRNILVNRCLSEMGVEYDVRPLPPGAIKRMTEPKNVGSEVPLKRSKEEAKAEGVGTSGEAATVGTRVGAS